MFKKIISFLLEVATSRKKIKELEQDARDPAKVIAEIMGRGIYFYDYDGIEEPNDKIVYYQNIQRVLDNPAFQNEINHYLADVVQEIATCKVDINKDKPLRYSINGVETLMERMKNLQDPRDEKEATKDDIYNVV